MLRIAICADDVKLTSEIESLIYMIETTNKFSIDVFFSGESLLNEIATGAKYDLLYLDIEMDGINGIDTAQEIRKTDTIVIIIFITAHFHYALAGYEVNAFRFLLKPINEDKFTNYYKLAIGDILETPKYYRYTFNRENFCISISHIMYFESQGRTVYIHTSYSSQEKCYTKLNDIEHYLLSNNIYFFRISQSFLVNPDFVYSNMYNKMVLQDNTQLVVSEKRRKKVNKLFCKIKGDKIYD
ncbi:LytTR family DNA-binding domain-containing protein [Bengtsoniella intestinalis]|uniref:LytR/AlgR family response regulator transcription factor n=1 Tax=Bengtsoniella intestinalis TaxID=3073143 RepID=UPI00391F6157